MISGNHPARHTVVGIGEILWDIFDDRKTLGGAPANFAYHASCAGAEGIVVSAIGDDAYGDEIEFLLREKRLGNRLQRCDRPTGTVRISLDSSGVAQYVFPPDVAWDHLKFDDSLRTLAQSADAAAFGTLARRAPRSRETVLAFLNAMPENALRVCDLNLRQNFYTSDLIHESLAIADILKINEDELDILETLFDAGAGSGLPARCKIFSEKIFPAFPRMRYLIVTCGASGSFAGTRDGAHSFVPANKLPQIADTVGAGDAFTASFTVAILNGKTLTEAHRFAASRAEFVCTRSGAMPEFPADKKF